MRNLLCTTNCSMTMIKRSSHQNNKGTIVTCVKEMRFVSCKFIAYTVDIYFTPTVWI